MRRRHIARQLDALALELDLIAGTVDHEAEAELNLLAVELEAIAEKVRPKARRP